MIKIRLYAVMTLSIITASPCFSHENEKYVDQPQIIEDITPYLHFPRFGFGFINQPHDAPCPVIFYGDGIGIALDPGFCPAEDRKKPIREIAAYGSFNVTDEFSSARASARADCKGKPLLTRYTLDHHPSAGCRIKEKDGTIRLFTRAFRNSNAPDRFQWIELTLQLRTTYEHWEEDLRAFEAYSKAFRIDPDASSRNETVK
jgi:hypothetical protein